MGYASVPRLPPSDGCSDAQRQPTLNFTASTRAAAAVLKSIDCTDQMAEGGTAFSQPAESEQAQGQVPIIRAIQEWNWVMQSVRFPAPGRVAGTTRAGLSSGSTRCTSKWPSLNTRPGPSPVSFTSSVMHTVQRLAHAHRTRSASPPRRRGAEAFLSAAPRRASANSAWEPGYHDPGFTAGERRQEHVKAPEAGWPGAQQRLRA